MKYWLFILVIMTSMLGNAQPERGKKLKSFPILPAINNPKVNILNEKPLNNNPFSATTTKKNNEPLFSSKIKGFEVEKNPSFVIGENRDNILNSEKTFVNPNLDILDKLNNKTSKPVSDGFAAIRGNQDLGNFKLDSKFVNIRYRDFGEVDGDLIRIYLNGKVIENSILLDNFYQGLEIKLEQGFNKIDFEALNQGTQGPNTAEFQVYDDNKKLISSDQWNLVTGFKATIMITKD